METVLLIVTACSVVVALGAAFLVWRLRQREQERQRASIAALSAAIDNEHDVATLDVVRPEPGLAGGTPGAWLQPVESAPRLADESLVTPASGDLDLVAGTAQRAPSTAAVGAGSMFSAIRGDTDDGDSPVFTTRRLLAGAAVAGALLLAAVLASGGGAAATGRSDTRSAPLELLALRHEQQDGGVKVLGVVRNPDAAPPLRRLAAVVSFFDGTGAFVGSSLAPVDFTTLAPGEESPFTVSVNPAPPAATRYRVSFRRDAGVLPHVDRREKS